MAMRDLVTSGSAYVVLGSSTSSNPLGVVANALLDSSSKV
jgi:peroxin-5